MASLVDEPPLPLAMAVSRVVLLGFLAHFGLVPRPGDAGSAPEADARAERARLRALLPDGVEVEGAYVTAVRTWGGFARHRVLIACQK